MKIDMHIHTAYSYGVNTPETVIARAKAVGLDGVAITDYNSMGALPRAMDAAETLDMIVIPGKEIRLTHRGQTVGELMVYFLEKDIRYNRLADLGRIIDAVKDQDAIIAVSQPFNRSSEHPQLLKHIEDKKFKIGAFEAFNAQKDAHSNSKGIEYALRKNLAQIGGSGARTAQEIGQGYTYCETNDIESFRKLLKKKKSMAIGYQKDDVSQFYHNILAKIARPFV